MIKATDGYLTPTEAKRKGFVKKDGVYYKRTVLEKYRDKGWLGQVTSQYSDDDRMAAGLRLAAGDTGGNNFVGDENL